MPTGYTCKIEDGTIDNGKDFIKLCLNNFGIMAHNMGNASTLESQDFSKVYADEIEYHTKALNNYKKQLIEIENAFKEDYDNYKERVRKEIEEKLAHNRKYLQEQKDIDALYLRIKSEVEAWDCSESFDNIKKFCLQQIEDSRPERYMKYIVQEIEVYEESLTNFDEYFKNYQIEEVNRLSRLISYYSKSILDYKKKIKEKQKFYDSLIKEISSL